MNAFWASKTSRPSSSFAPSSQGLGTKNSSQKWSSVTGVRSPHAKALPNGPYDSHTLRYVIDAADHRPDVRSSEPTRQGYRSRDAQVHAVSLSQARRAASSAPPSASSTPNPPCRRPPEGRKAILVTALSRAAPAIRQLVLSALPQLSPRTRMAEGQFALHPDRSTARFTTSVANNLFVNGRPENQKSYPVEALRLELA